jgi:serine protease AprX
LALTLAFSLGLAAPGYAKPGDHAKLDKTLNERAGKAGFSRVIVTLEHGWDVSTEARKLGGKLGRRLNLVNGMVVELPNGQLKKLASVPGVRTVHLDRPTGGEMARVAVTAGARAAQIEFGATGTGVGVAVIDSGITGWHDDLTYQGSSTAVRVVGGQRVSAFVDFVNGRTAAYDDNGHGTHVSGIIAGNGYDSLGARAGIAPSAHIASLKVLDQNGRGVISNVIAAIEWAITNKTAQNIRVINLSVGAAVTESYNTDPLTLAAKRAVEAGIVVVTAAGNLGKNRAGVVQYGAITAPGNAPWVLTVGAYSDQGTVYRTDDVIALYSSRGPTAIDFGAKPDLVAPGTGVVSLSNPNSLFYTTKATSLLKGSFLRPTSYKPYLSLSGTSMAAPVVTGTVALMMQVNPTLTPNMVKAILQFTAQKYNYDALTQGAGFLNSRGAVQLARFYRTATPGAALRVPYAWSKQIIWGNRRISRGIPRPNTNAWLKTTVWGSAFDADGENIVWGSLCDGSCENIVWGAFDALSEENIVWGSLFNADGENIVWGTFFDDAENIVWGSLMDEENIVWGSDCAGADCENIVWGASFSDELDPALENIVWGTAELAEAVLWTSDGAAENIVWGTSSEEDNVTWGNSGEEEMLFEAPDGEPVNYDATVFDNLFGGSGVADETTPATSPVAEPTTVPLPTGILGGGL